MIQTMQSSAELRQEMEGLTDAQREALMEADVDAIQRIGARRMVLPVLLARATAQEAADVSIAAGQALEAAERAHATAEARRQALEEELERISHSVREQLGEATKQAQAAADLRAAAANAATQAASVARSAAQLVTMAVDDAPRALEVQGRIAQQLTGIQQDLRRLTQVNEEG